MQIDSLQKQAFRQRKSIDLLIKSYKILKRKNPKLRGFEPLTSPYYLRNYSTRERLCYELVELRGVRSHHLVQHNSRSVVIWAIPADMDPVLAHYQNYPSEVIRDRATSDPHGEVIRNYRQFLHHGSHGGREIASHPASPRNMRQ